MTPNPARSPARSHPTGLPPTKRQVTRTESPDRFAPDETRAALRWTRRAADVEHGLAESVVHDLPQLMAAWLAGVVDRPRVGVFDQYLTGLTLQQIDKIFWETKAAS